MVSSMPGVLKYGYHPHACVSPYFGPGLPEKIKHDEMNEAQKFTLQCYFLQRGTTACQLVVCSGWAFIGCVVLSVTCLRIHAALPAMQCIHPQLPVSQCHPQGGSSRGGLCSNSSW